jgi:hypothetical protein
VKYGLHLVSAVKIAPDYFLHKTAAFVPVRGLKVEWKEEMQVSTRLPAAAATHSISCCLAACVVQEWEFCGSSIAYVRAVGQPTLRAR